MPNETPTGGGLIFAMANFGPILPDPASPPQASEPIERYLSERARWLDECQAVFASMLERCLPGLNTEFRPGSPGEPHAEAGWLRACHEAVNVCQGLQERYERLAAIPPGGGAESLRVDYEALTEFWKGVCLAAEVQRDLRQLAANTLYAAAQRVAPWVGRVYGDSADDGSEAMHWVLDRLLAKEPGAGAWSHFESDDHVVNSLILRMKRAVWRLRAIDVIIDPVTDSPEDQIIALIEIERTRALLLEGVVPVVMAHRRGDAAIRLQATVDEMIAHTEGSITVHDMIAQERNSGRPARAPRSEEHLLDMLRSRIHTRHKRARDKLIAEVIVQRARGELSEVRAIMLVNYIKSLGLRYHRDGMADAEIIGTGE